MIEEPLLRWPEPILALLEFVGAFLALGAVGFRYFVIRRTAARSDVAAVEVYADAARRAALLGLTGALLGLVHLGSALPKLAERLGTTLGAWNWRRQRPQLGTDRGVDSIRRSATAELVVAGVVLALTAILVSLPSPK